MYDIKQETKDKYLSTMTSTQLRNFVTIAIEEYGTEEKLQEANRVISAIRALYIKKKIIADNVDPYFLELMETAAFVHNLFTDGTWISVFTARDKLYDVAVKAGIKREHVEHIFTIVEGQLWFDMPVAGARPNPNSPVEDFALCCWLVKEFKNG